MENKLDLNFVSLEITSSGLNPDKNQLVEIAATEFNDGKAIDDFYILIQPNDKIPDYFMKIHGFDESTFDNAVSFADGIKEFRKFIGKKKIVSENVYKKFEFINMLCAYEGLIDFQNVIFDISELGRIFFPTIHNFEIHSLAEELKLEKIDFSNIKMKSEVIGKIFLKISDYILQKVPFAINNEIYNITKQTFLKTDLDYYFELVANKQRKFALMKSNLHLPKIKNKNFIQKKCTKKDLLINDIFKENGEIHSHLPYYELRKSQIELSEEIFSALNNDNFLLSEAGTGVGKSLAYLIPSIIFAEENAEKVVVTTNTKNLQEQLFFKDIPLIKNSLEIPFTAVLLKGRDNYVCINKWNNFRMNYEQILNKYSMKDMLPLIVWMKVTTTGDIGENSAFDKKKNSIIWKNIVADRFTCKGRKCANYNECFLMNIRKKAEKASLIVTNHSLLLSDLLSDKSTLGNYSNLVLDEAHNLPDIAASHLGGSISFIDLKNSLQRLFYVRNEFQAGILPSLKGAIQKSSIDESKEKFLLDIIEKIIKLIPIYLNQIEPFFVQIADLVQEKGSFNKLRIRDIKKNNFLMENLEELETLFSQISDDLLQMQESFENISKNVFPDYDTFKSNLDGVTLQFNEIVLNINLFSHTNPTDNAIWLSKFFTDNKDFPSGILNYAPLDVSQILNDKLYSKLHSLIFTSATLAIRGKFKYFESRIGLNLIPEQKIKKFIAGSPFNYEKQTNVFVPTFLPNPKDNYFRPQATTVIKDCIINSDTGTLVLFTSYYDLNQVYDELSKEFEKTNRLLLAQGKGLSRTAIIKEFKKNGKGVILGTSSFWEGVDVQGDALSLLILYKLPFQVPSDPIVEAYLEKLQKENKNSFMHFMLPNALLKYKQGFGRLIRSKKDNGVVITLDNRVTTKRYGKYFQQILPKKSQLVNSNIGLKDHIARWFHQ